MRRLVRAFPPFIFLRPDLKEPSSLPFGIGIDTGGTFTDIVLYDFPGRRILRKAKTPTTHGDYAVCIGAAFREVALESQEIAQLARVCLSTTLATNAVAENRIHPTCLIVEPGDIAVPPDVHPRLVLLKSQLAFDTMEVVPVSSGEVLKKVAPHAEAVESFAVSGYAATRSPVHEQQIAAILKEKYGKPVVLGSELTHQLNFLQRARAAALNAGLLPVVMEWLQAVRGIMAGLAIGCPLYIVKGDGSLMEEGEALLRPVQTLFSGPASSLTGGALLSGGMDALVVDVGGTTTDMGRIVRGRGLPKAGGVTVQGRNVAVDGLDMATFGLGGDSRFRLGGRHTGYFESRRALPFCRAPAQFEGFSLERLEEALEGQWHFGDPSLLDMVALDPLRLNHAGALAGPQAKLVETLRGGPLTLRHLAERTAVPQVPHVAGAVEELVRRRVLVWISLTPTDFFCAEGRIPLFSEQAARHAMTLYARMLDLTVAAFSNLLREALRRQSTALLALFLGSFDPPLTPEDSRLERLVEMLLASPDTAEPMLALDPRQPLVLVGAGAPLMFEGLPGPLRERVVIPEHGEVANAVGAVASRFLLRESATIEPLRYGGVEVFDHQGKRAFPTLEHGLRHARASLEGHLKERAQALGLADPEWEWHQEVLEDYADFSRRTRKELVIARVEALLTGMPQ